MELGERGERPDRPDDMPDEFSDFAELIFEAASGLEASVQGSARNALAEAMWLYMGARGYLR